MIHIINPKGTKWGDKTKEELQQLLNTCNTYKEVANKLGYLSNRGAYTDCIKRMVEYHQLDTTIIDQNRKNHLSKASHNALIEYHKTKRLSEQEIQTVIQKWFIEDSPIRRKSIRKFILDYNIIPYQCKLCGNEGVWLDKPLTLELDHINGHHNDHRLNNLRWLCPNCHATTDTHRGKNIVILKNEQDKPQYNRKIQFVYQKHIHEKTKCCPICGQKICDEANYCAKCYKAKLREKYPNREELKEGIRNNSFVQLGKYYNVTDNAIRRWCDYYNLPRHSKEIKQYTDTEWQLI